jgi:hypothetical protein
MCLTVGLIGSVVDLGLGIERSWDGHDRLVSFKGKHYANNNSIHYLNRNSFRKLEYFRTIHLWHFVRLLETICTGSHWKNN